jgi:DNA-binding PucR family transcriptional regulator
VARIEQLTGLDLDDPRDRGAVWLAALARRDG